jgi:dCTP deaminase
MILSDRDIEKALNNGVIKISPKPNLSDALGSCNLDLQLGTIYRVFNHSRTPFIDPQDKKTLSDLTTEIIIKNGESFTLHPGEFILAMTREYIEMPDHLMGRLEGRSSIGRLGVVVHSTAATVDPGFRGNITLELANMGRIPVMLYPGMRICSISFEQLSSPARVPYYKNKSAKYSGQKAPVASKIGEER